MHAWRLSKPAAEWQLLQARLAHDRSLLLLLLHACIQVDGLEEADMRGGFENPLLMVLQELFDTLLALPDFHAIVAPCMHAG